MKSYRFYSDPAHGWLRVPVAELSALGIATKVSSCSYRKGRWAYLEEDCDAPRFIQEFVRKHERRPHIVESSCNGRSTIRSYPAYHADPPISEPDPVLDPMRAGLKRQFLKAAAGRKMLCDCGRVLDWTDTVVLTPKHGASISCCQCWIDGSNQAIEKYGQHAIDQFHEWAENDVIDSAWNWHWENGRMTKGAQLIK